MLRIEAILKRLKGQKVAIRGHNQIATRNWPLRFRSSSWGVRWVSSWKLHGSLKWIVSDRNLLWKLSDSPSVHQLNPTNDHCYDNAGIDFATRHKIQRKLRSLRLDSGNIPTYSKNVIGVNRRVFLMLVEEVFLEGFLVYFSNTTVFKSFNFTLSNLYLFSWFWQNLGS